MKIYLYILQSQGDGRYYIGITNDIQRRLQEHNLHKNTSTRNYGPFKLICTVSFRSYAEARKIEKILKKYTTDKLESFVKKVLNKELDNTITEPDLSRP